MDNEEILRQCKETRGIIINHGYLLDDNDYNIWEEKCIEFYSNEERCKKDSEMWDITFDMEEGGFSRQITVYGDVDRALLAYDVFYPQSHNLKLSKYAEAVIKEKILMS